MLDENLKILDVFSKWDEKKFNWRFAAKRRKIILSKFFTQIKEEQDKNTKRANEVENLLKEERIKLEQDAKKMLKNAQEQVKEYKKSERKMRKEKEKAEQLAAEMQEERDTERSKVLMSEDERNKYQSEIVELKHQLEAAKVWGHHKI